VEWFAKSETLAFITKIPCAGNMELTRNC